MLAKAPMAKYRSMTPNGTISRNNGCRKAPSASGDTRASGWDEVRQYHQTLCYTSACRTRTVALKVEVRSILKKRSRLSLAVTAFVAVAVSFILLGCGKNFYFAGRTLPPSGVTQRVLVAVDNPVGSLQFMDAYYDIRHPFNNPNGQFSIGGFSGQYPVTIQNLPEEQTGLVYS